MRVGIERQQRNNVWLPRDKILSLSPTKGSFTRKI